jgi:hypothetical protein
MMEAISFQIHPDSNIVNPILKGFTVVWLEYQSFTAAPLNRRMRFDTDVPPQHFRPIFSSFPAINGRWSFGTLREDAI